MSMEKLAGDWGKLSLGWQILLGSLVAIALWLLWATLGIRIAYWGWVGDWLPWHALEKPDKIVALGQIGDLFGGVNALFAAFAFVGVAIAAYYQHKTFTLQAAQDIRQSFEPLFFKLLDRHEPPGTLVATSLPADWARRDKFEGVIAGLRAELRIMLRALTTMDNKEAVRLATFHAFMPLYELNDGVLAPYFRKLYHLFKLIAMSELSWEEKVRYANIARASLNKDELLLLLLNCICEQGRDFKPLVEGFGLLKHIALRDDHADSIEKLLASHLYAPTATMNASDRAKYWMYNPAKRPDWGEDAPI